MDHHLQQWVHHIIMAILCKQHTKGYIFNTQPHRIQAGPSYLYYPTTPMEGATFSAAYRPLQQPLIRQPSPTPSPSGNLSILFFILI